MQTHNDIQTLIADMLQSNAKNPFSADHGQAPGNWAEAAAAIIKRLASTSSDNFPIQAESHGVRFILAPGRERHRLFALIWDGRMWRTGAEWQLSANSLVLPASTSTEH